MFVNFATCKAILTNYYKFSIMKRLISFLLAVIPLCIGVNAQLMPDFQFSVSANQLAPRATAQGVVSPDTVNLSTIVGVPVSGVITITNTGTVPIDYLTSFSSMTTFFTLTDNIGEIPPAPGNNVGEIIVTYLPTAAGKHHANYTIRIGDVFHRVSLDGVARDAKRGDADGDDEVTINDVAVIIDYLLENNEGSIFVLDGANADNDAQISINDAAVIIDYLLYGTWPESEGPDTSLNETFTVNGVTFTMVGVQGGTFTMGGTPEQGDGTDEDEYPTHEVTLSSFSIGETPVTQELWLAVMGSNPSEFSSANGYTENLNKPVDSTPWNDCQEFIIRLNELTGRVFRLPTEAEWEFAARGGIKSKGFKFAGSNSLGLVGWYAYNMQSTTPGSEGYGTQPVKTKLPNELGIYDMSGNVREWCQDFYGYYSAEPQTNPYNSTGAKRNLRGGTWSGVERYSRVSYRTSALPTAAERFNGMRLALDAPDAVSLSVAPDGLSIELEEERFVDILHGSGNYTYTVEDGQEHVSCRLFNNQLYVTGMSCGCATITIKDNVRLQETSIEVQVTPSLSQRSLTLMVDEQTTIDISNGSGSYSIEGCEDIVQCQINNHQIIVQGINIGSGTVTVKDRITQTKTTFQVDVFRAVADETFTVNGVSFTMKAVPGGTFTMGQPAEGQAYYGNSKPVHDVKLSSYQVCETEVTQALWVAVMGTNPSRFSSAYGYTENLNKPVERVNWEDCQEFISRLNALTGKSFRLPTEAEWEYAARGGRYSENYKYSGSNVRDEVAWYKGNIPSTSSGSNGYGTQPVKTKLPNELGVYDMSGNVEEWCQDWYGDYQGRAQINPTGPETGTRRVVRGGGWSVTAGFDYELVIIVRKGYEPSSTSDSRGLRLVL